jgi:hypothetical protein
MEYDKSVKRRDLKELTTGGEGHYGRSDGTSDIKQLLEHHCAMRCDRVAKEADLVS